MRNFSRLGLKLLGILFLYWAISDLCLALAELSFLFSQWMPAEKANLMRALHREVFASTLRCIALGILAAMLLSRTEWIISRLKLPEEGVVASTMAPEELLRVCLIVVGSVAVINGIPGLAVGLLLIKLMPHGLDLANASPDKSGFVATGKVMVLDTLCENASSTVRFVLGWVLVVKSRKLAAEALAL